jgi:hypothetical protein
MVSFGHCVVCSSSIYGFWLPLCHLLAIVLSVLRYTDSDYPFVIFWPLCCLSFFDIRILITPLLFLSIVLSVLLRYTDSDYPFGIFWPLWCLSFFDIRILITPLVSFGHCVVCSSSIYRFWLPPFGIFWPLCCLFFFDIQILITSLWYLQTFLIWYLVICSVLLTNVCIFVLFPVAFVFSVLRSAVSDYTFGMFKLSKFMLVLWIID